MNKTIMISVLILAAIVAVLAFVYADDADDRRASQREAVIYIARNGERTEEIDLDTLMDQEQEEFTATLKSSDAPAREHDYVGVELRKLFENLEIDLEGATQVISRAVDGYTVALELEEVMQPDNVYVVHSVDGEPMAPREEGGSGPYQLVIRGDEFGQRWTKHLMELDLR
ncbi:MAG: molybdopterin-dependent oxidoreductase [Bacillota bacterium]